ncbi:hypothetical protein [Mesonia sp. HuA40]|uniref:hypothetical protein n=1 Tax=Mesonia sp. HuA40 TaxID=2602761 RepID=UPI0021076741|nr:hypothetical protein [Mesonia sp. HuA40]
MNTQQKTTLKDKPKPQQSKRKILKSLLTGSYIALAVAATPFIFYSYESFPDSKTWETFLFTFESNYYEKVNVSIWTMMTKFIPLFLLVIWFLTCKHWWYHVILIPTGMFLFQLISVLNDDLRITDETELIYVLPIMLATIPLIYLIRARIITRINPTNLDELEADLMQKKTVWEQLKDLFR